MAIPNTTTVIAPIAPSSVLDLFATHLATWGKGGLRSEATIGDRDGISTARREHGMECFVQSNETKYRLMSDLVTWGAVGEGGSGGTGAGITIYETFQEMVEAADTDLTFVQLNNWFTGDRTLSLWLAIPESVGIVPNGQDVQQNTANVMLWMFASRPFNPDAPAIPPVFGVAYTLGISAYSPTITDFRNSAVLAPMIQFPDLNGDKKAQWEFDATNGEVGTRGVDWDRNLVAHYKRI